MSATIQPNFIIFVSLRSIYNTSNEQRWRAWTPRWTHPRPLGNKCDEVASVELSHRPLLCAGRIGCFGSQPCKICPDPAPCAIYPGVWRDVTCAQQPAHRVLPGLRGVAFCVASLRRISRHLACSNSNLRLALPRPPPTLEWHEGFCSCRKARIASLPPKAFSLWYACESAK